MQPVKLFGTHHGYICITTDYIMLELLKNSMRATVEHHGIDADFPPIKVVSK